MTQFEEGQEALHRAYYLGRLEEQAATLRNTMWRAKELGLDPEGNLRKAHTLICEVIRPTRAKVTGKSEEQLAEEFIDRLKGWNLLQTASAPEGGVP